MNGKMTDAFITQAAETLGDTDNGLTGSEICKCTAAYAIDYDIEIPFTAPPLKDKAGQSVNKRTALRENFKCFSDNALYIIIRDLCALEKFKNNDDVQALKLKLFKNYRHLAPPVEDFEPEMVEETSHWLMSNYPEAGKFYHEAFDKYLSKDEKLYRNALDDARFALEVLLKQVLDNGKSLENQLQEIGKFVNQKRASKEFTNMFQKLIEYYSKYQNKRVKHDEGIIESELAFILELTTVFMRQFVRLNS